MPEFDTTSKDLDIIYVGKEVIIEFPYHDIKEIRSMISSCDCNRVYNYRKDSKVVVKYIPRENKSHLDGYIIMKIITICYTSDLHPGEEVVEKLTFTAKVRP